MYVRYNRSLKYNSERSEQQTVRVHRSDFPVLYYRYHHRYDTRSGSNAATPTVPCPSAKPRVFISLHYHHHSFSPPMSCAPGAAAGGVCEWRVLYGAWASQQGSVWNIDAHSSFCFRALWVLVCLSTTTCLFYSSSLSSSVSRALELAFLFFALSFSQRDKTLAARSILLFPPCLTKCI
jgi:hypothetical protein